jgi:hypothetical protein
MRNRNSGNQEARGSAQNQEGTITNSNNINASAAENAVT